MPALRQAQAHKTDWGLEKEATGITSHLEVWEGVQRGTLDSINA